MAAAELFEAQLRADYREPLRHDRFVGRRRELERLEEILANRASSTVLLAGYRGTGKTALVDQALRPTKKMRNQLVVRIAPPHLDQGSNQSQIRSELLRSMVRGLYFESLKIDGLPKGLRAQISASYNKAYIKELESSTAIEAASQHTNQQRRSNTVETSVKMLPAMRVLAGGFIATLIAILGLNTAASITEQLGNGWGILSLAVIALLAAIGGLSLRHVKQSDTSVTDDLTQKERRTEIAKLDLSDTALEYELNQSLGKLAEKKCRAVFVFDELDKLVLDGEAPETIERTPTFAILTCLKNFFSSSNAVYVFITDDEFFEKLSLEQRGTGYRLSHTIFTDRLYVGPLHYLDVERLIDLSLVKPPAAEDYDRFQNFICWESSNHAFDILQVLDQFVENRDGRPTLCPKPTGEFSGVWQEGNLPDDWLTRAALQKHVGVEYDDARRSGRGEELYNQALWESLRESAAMLLDEDPLKIIDESVHGVPGRFYQSLSYQDKDSVNGAIQRMLIRMERHGAATERTVPFNEDHDEFDEYQFDEIDDIQVFRIATDVEYPRSTVALESVLLPAEQALIEAFDHVERIISRAGDSATLSDDETQVRNSLKQICDQLRDTGPRKTQKRSTVRSSLAEAMSLAGTVIERLLRAVIRNWAESQGCEMGVGLDAASPHTGRTWRDDWSADFGPLIDTLDDQGIRPLIIGGGATENALAVLLPLGDDAGNAVRDAYSECLARSNKTKSERRQRLPLVRLGTGGNKSSKLAVDEVEAITEEFQSPSWYMYMLWLSRPVKKSTGRLAGWTEFELESDLQNLGQLTDELEKSVIRAGGRTVVRSQPLKSA